MGSAWAARLIIVWIIVTIFYNVFTGGATSGLISYTNITTQLETILSLTIGLFTVGAVLGIFLGAKVIGPIVALWLGALTILGSGNPFGGPILAIAASASSVGGLATILIVLGTTITIGTSSMVIWAALSLWA